MGRGQKDVQKVVSCTEHSLWFLSWWIVSSAERSLCLDSFLGMQRSERCSESRLTGWTFTVTCSLLGGQSAESSQGGSGGSSPTSPWTTQSWHPAVCQDWATWIQRSVWVCFVPHAVGLPAVCLLLKTAYQLSWEATEFSVRAKLLRQISQSNLLLIFDVIQVLVVRVCLLGSSHFIFLPKMLPLNAWNITAVILEDLWEMVDGKGQGLFTLSALKAVQFVQPLLPGYFGLAVQNPQLLYLELFYYVK